MPLKLVEAVKQKLTRQALKGQLIYKKRHKLNKVMVYENQEYRWLCFNQKAIQSQIDRHQPWRPVMHFIRPLTIPILTLESFNPSVLVLGGGCGSLYHFLTHRFPDLSINVIEHNSEVIKAGHLFFFLPKHYATLADAKTFIKYSKKRYSHLLIDLFTTSISSLYKEHAFLSQLHVNALESLSFNLLCPNKQLRTIINTIKKVCGDNTLLLFIPNSTNVVFHVLKQTTISSYLQLLESKELISSIKWDSSLGFSATWVKQEIEH